MKTKRKEPRWKTEAMLERAWTLSDAIGDYKSDSWGNPHLLHESRKRLQEQFSLSQSEIDALSQDYEKLDSSETRVGTDSNLIVIIIDQNEWDALINGEHSHE